MKVSLFLCVILGGVAPFFFFGGPGYHSPQSYKAAWNLGHIFFFSVVTILLFPYLIRWKRQWHELQHLSVVFFLVLVAGVLVEFLQMYSSHRSPDVYDILRNQLGCLVGYTLITFKYKAAAARWWVWPFRCFVCACLLFALWPLTRSLVDEHVARKQFPVLADFETPLERMRWMNSRQLKVQEKIVRHGKRAAQVRLTTATYSGTTLFNFPHNWYDYSILHFSVYNPLEQPLKLHCRIHDTRHKESGSAFSDRFHQKFTLHQGWNDLQVSLKEVEQAPKSRNMDMGQIENLGFFVVRQPEPRLMYLDHIYLSR
ncbi:VanZ family protein [Desulfogranum marinum]|uniref:VanZ family protein n=1 Tax=Desulfogranum marinum TaxID=453220 RepID=UPI0029C83B72|nr:VanZ family protein [Desulfogranum marinum]